MKQDPTYLDIVAAGYTSENILPPSEMEQLRRQRQKELERKEYKKDYNQKHHAKHAEQINKKKNINYKNNPGPHQKSSYVNYHNRGGKEKKVLFTTKRKQKIIFQTSRIT